ncbi:MAG: histidine phosphatase family protein [Bryobacteraceae bacterium]|nr:histidine phosphatase family protein [Bryobacteraceae bacterium]
MSSITLVRHGQASYMEADYDKLSGLGEEQARKLGQYWVRHKITFDHVFHGPAKRHIRTTEIAGELVRAAGLPWPEPQRLPDFDEFDAFTMMRIMTPVLAVSDARVRQLNQDFQTNRDTPEAGRLLQKLFEEVARQWSSGKFETPDMETWEQFRARVASALKVVRDSSGASASSVVFTSGGPIAATVGHVLDLNATRTIEFVWLSRNCSYSQFLFSGERMSLHAFNAIPHFDDLKLFTYR